MKTKTIFTKKDLLVTFGCVVFLLANLGAIGSGGRRRAKEAICLSNLRQWGILFQTYTNDNDGFFQNGIDTGNPSGTYDGYWVNALRPLHKNNYNLLMCPEASKPQYDEFGTSTGARHPFAAWGVMSPAPGVGPWGYLESRANDRSGYGINGWVSNPIMPSSYGPGASRYWRTPNIKGGDNVPLLLDALWFGGWPQETDEPPLYSGYISSWNFMDFFCLNRHDGFVNSLFIDFSARKVGLKELWTLKWHREFDTTHVAGGWPDWMADFEDY